jgi:hypothetical protein
VAPSCVPPAYLKMMHLLRWAACFVSFGLGTQFPHLGAAEPPPDLPIGMVIESVPCLADASQTYAVYLPSTYTAERRWPILYAFDSRARGAVPTKLFAATAERLGYVVVGSNNSRNGPLPPIAAAMDAIWHDTHTRFALDPGRIYATGMSGGNLPALQLGARFGSGLIACAGATRPEDVVPRDRAFAMICAAGNGDFNFSANSRMVEALVARGFVARLAVFEGDHGWPPKDVAARTLEFLHLAAMRTGRLSVDAAFLDDYAERAQTRARELAATGDVNGAAEEYAALARELAGLRSTETFETEAKRLHDSPDARKNRDVEEAMAERFAQQSGELHQLRRLVERGRLFAPMRSSRDGGTMDLEDEGGAIGIGGNGQDASAAETEIESRIERLLIDIESDKPDVRLVARRVLDGFYLNTWYSAQELREKRSFEPALGFYRLCARMRPKSATPIYELARTHAAKGDRRKALAELRKVKDLGFRDAARLATEPEWASVREDRKFTEIVTAMRAGAADTKNGE